MDKEKEIEEMINDIDINCNNIADKDCAKGKCALCISEHLVSVGYRKVDEVRKETAKELLDKLLVISPLGYEQLKAFVRVREQEYGIEVD